MPVGRAEARGRRVSLASVRDLLLQRWPGGLLALVGLGLAVPTVWLPTFRLVLSDAGRGAILSEETAWSWGRNVMRGGPERVFDNDQGVVLLLITLGLGLVGAVVWLVVPGVVGLLLALVGVTALTSRMATAVAQRLGRAAEVEVYQPTGLDVRSYTLPGAVLETMSGVVLGVALVVMVAQALRWIRLSARGDEPSRGDPGQDEEAERGPLQGAPARVGVARLAPEPMRPGGDRRIGGEAVSFTDQPRDDEAGRRR